MGVTKFILFLFAIVIAAIKAQPDGWKMTDRFYGFRYQITGSADIVEKIQQAADNLSCFGWIQNTTDQIYVGEARCNKWNGIKFEEVVRSLHQSTQSQSAIKVKIT
jgi:hypothetical protein